MTDGTLSVRRRQAKASESSANDLFSLAVLRAGAYESFLGSLPSIGQGKVKSKQKSKPIGDVDEFRVESKRKKRLKEYDRLLKGFKYSDALDAVLRKVRFGSLDYGEWCIYPYTASTTDNDLLPYPRVDTSRRSTNRTSGT